MRRRKRRREFLAGFVSLLLLFRDFVIVENIRLVLLLDLTSEFGVKTNAKLTPIIKLRDKRAKLVFKAVCTHNNPNFNFFAKKP